MSRSLRSLALFFGIVFLLAVGGVLGTFLKVNPQWVLLHFPSVRFSLDDPFVTVGRESPLWLVMTTAFCAGFAAALLLIALPGWLRRGVERRRERRFVRGLEGELTGLRNLPVTEPAPLEDLAEERSPVAGAVPESAEEEERALLAAALQEPEKGTGR